MCESGEVVLDRLARFIRFALNCTEGLSGGEVDFLQKLLTTVDYPEEESPFNNQNGNLTQGFTDSFPNNGGNAKTGREVSATLKNLEIIKVVVLIVVISIILFTTCRMVFQLFVRFRPEKNSFS